MKKRFLQRTTSNKKHKRIGHETEKTDSLLSMIICACRATMIAFAVGILLLFGATAAAFSREDPAALAMPLGYAAAAITACFSGFLTVRFVGRRVLLSGLFSAACLLFLFTILSFFPQLAVESAQSLGRSLALHAAVVPICLLGAYLGRRKTTARHRR